VLPLLGLALHAALFAQWTRPNSGRVSLPADGWIAARARGGATVWPSIDSYPFAHTGPIWIGSVGSLDPEGSRLRA
jgi:TolB protein